MIKHLQIKLRFSALIMALFLSIGAIWAQQTSTVYNDGTISATVSPIGSGSVQGTGVYKGGTSCNLTPVANDGYVFLNWTYNGVLVLQESLELKLNVNGDASFVANFVKEVKEDEIIRFDSDGNLSEFKKTAADGTIMLPKI